MSPSFRRKPKSRGLKAEIPAFVGMTWIIRSKTQHHLRDDVALDRVRPAIDRRLAHVEIGRRGAVGVIGADRMLVVARTVGGSETAAIGLAIMADCPPRTVGPPPLD